MKSLNHPAVPSHRPDDPRPVHRCRRGGPCPIAVGSCEPARQRRLLKKAPEGWEVTIHDGSMGKRPAWTTTEQVSKASPRSRSRTRAEWTTRQVMQKVTVKPHTRYKLTGMIKIREDMGSLAKGKDKVGRHPRVSRVRLRWHPSAQLHAHPHGPGPCAQWRSTPGPKTETHARSATGTTTPQQSAGPLGLPISPLWNWDRGRSRTHFCDLERTRPACRTMRPRRPYEMPDEIHAKEPAN